MEGPALHAVQVTAAKDPETTKEALKDCVCMVSGTYRRGKKCFESLGVCACGRCIPLGPIDSQHILRAQLMMCALYVVWLNSEAVDVTAQRTAVQHMLVSDSKPQA